MNQLPRHALSRYGLTFQGNILSVNCQFRMRTRVRAHALHLTRGELLNY